MPAWGDIDVWTDGSPQENRRWEAAASSWSHTDGTQSHQHDSVTDRLAPAHGLQMTYLYRRHTLAAYPTTHAQGKRGHKCSPNPSERHNRRRRHHAHALLDANKSPKQLSYAVL